MRTFKIAYPDRSMEPAIQAKIDNLNKPKHSLGVLEELALQICLVQQRQRPRLNHPCHLLLGGDHGIEREQVSVSPRDVTWQQMINFTRGGGGVNMFCRQHEFDLSIVDVGVDHDLSTIPAIYNYKIARGTKNFLHEAAMSMEEFNRAIQVGIELVNACKSKGCNVICIGEMGIGNTSPSSIWMSLFCKIPLAECVGAGAGLDTAGMQHKYEVLQAALDHFQEQYKEPETIDILRYFGGFEMITAIGVMLRAAELKMIILIDGFIMTACALGAVQLYPAIREYMIFGHCGDEGGHRRMLQHLNANPILNLGLRLGEGTGALCAYPIVASAVHMVNEMNNFKGAKITKYF